MMTTEQRKAGMAAFRAQALKAQQSILAKGGLRAKDRAFIESCVATIKAAQQRLGEVS